MKSENTSNNKNIRHKSIVNENKNKDLKKESKAHFKYKVITEGKDDHRFVHGE